MPDAFTVEDQLITDDAEFKQILNEVPKRLHPKLRECMSQAKLYRITFNYDETNFRMEGYPDLYSSSLSHVQEIFDAIKLLPDCKTISVFLWMYEKLPYHLQYL